jgi:hypothetical protein
MGENDESAFSPRVKPEQFALSSSAMRQINGRKIHQQSVPKSITEINLLLLNYFYTHSLAG